MPKPRNNASDSEWLDDVYRRGYRTEPPLLVSDWADAHRILPSAEAEPGRWRTERTPYLREIMDCLSASSAIERVIFMKSAQIGATESAMNFCGYVIANAPGSLLYVMPTELASRKNVRTRIDPLIETTPELTALVTRRRSRQPGNTESMKTFPGGYLSFVGANSAVGLRTTPARYVICDEVDGFPQDVDKEGDAVSLAMERSVAFRGRRKAFLLSTPTIEGQSRIARAFKSGDQRRFFVPCPHCGALQVLKWAQVRWPGDDRAKAFYVCEHCGEAIHERHKNSMVAAGKWMATAESEDGKTASFHISSLYSPFVTWGEIAIKQKACGKDPAQLKTWTNTSLGETWEDRSMVMLDPSVLMARATSWGDGLPDAVVYITAGIDVQPNRLEVEFMGWGRGEQSWSLEYHSLPGSPAEQDVWLRLDELLLRKRPHRILGHLSVMATCVDSGFWPKPVYEFCGPRFYRHVFAIKGSSDYSAPVWPRRPSEPKPGRGSELFSVGSNAAKAVNLARLSIEEPGPGYCNFPTRDRDYFEMLLAKRPIKKIINGVEKYEWVKDPSTRAEAGDCRAYGLCALHALRSYGVDLDKRADQVAAMPIPVAGAGPAPQAPKRSMADFGKLVCQEALEPGTAEFGHSRFQNRPLAFLRA